MRRGEIWSVAGGPDYAGKPRPVVVLQDDHFEETASVTVCPFTTHSAAAPLFRLVVEASERNGLNAPSKLMVDKLMTVPRSKIGIRIGQLDAEDLVRLNRAVAVFLGLAGS
jgi:mRNA interferase MazF